MMLVDVLASYIMSHMVLGMQMLGLQKGSLQSFVLENDPVPRALLSVDPTFTALKQSRLGAALLQLRHSFLGPGVPLTPERFLADNVGQVNLIRWTPETGHKVCPNIIWYSSSE